MDQNRILPKKKLSQTIDSTTYTINIGEISFF